MRMQGLSFLLGLSLLGSVASADDAFVAVPSDFGGNEVPVGAQLVTKQEFVFVVDQDEIQIKQSIPDDGTTDTLICGIRLYGDKTDIRRVIPAGTVFAVTDRNSTKDGGSAPGICFKDNTARDNETLNYQLASAGGALVGVSCQLSASWSNDVGMTDGNLNQCSLNAVPDVGTLGGLFTITAAPGSLETVIH